MIIILAHASGVKSTYTHAHTHTYTHTRNKELDTILYIIFVEKRLKARERYRAMITEKILQLYYYLLLHKVNTQHSNLLIVPFNNYCRHIDEKGFFLVINY